MTIPLHFVQDSEVLLELLKDEDSYEYINKVDEFGFTPAMTYLHRHDLKSLKTLLDTDLVDFEVTDRHGDTLEDIIDQYDDFEADAILTEAKMARFTKERLKLSKLNDKEDTNEITTSEPVEAENR